MSFSPKRATEEEIFTADFVNILAAGESITSATWTSTVKRGIDPSPTSMISGTATISGTQVSQMIEGGVPNVFYSLTCTITTSQGQTLVLPEPGNDSLLVTA